jgi:hypothetical protein
LPNFFVTRREFCHTSLALELFRPNSARLNGTAFVVVPPAHFAKTVTQERSMKKNLLKHWSNDDYQVLEQGVLLAEHGLVETGLFTDEALIKIFDSHPESHLTISTMGHDTNVFQWCEGHRNGASAETLLQLVRGGHLWINVRRILDFQPAYAKLVHDLYDELQYNNPRFRAIDRTANLLISSPDALVHYHVDVPVNMLWHIRGKKRVWVYPHFDHRFVSQKVMELVCAGELSEDVPYDAQFDKYALVYDVEPGQLLTWPQHTPHRVNNLDGLNVSLSTEHKNARAVRRINVHLANHFLRHQFGLPSKSTKVDGPVAHAKQALARSVRMFERLANRQQPQYIYPKTFVVDPAEPNGFRFLETENEFVAPHEQLVE